jgi:predicted RNA-binding Zn ribbon-like protein
VRADRLAPLGVARQVDTRPHDVVDAPAELGDGGDGALERGARLGVRVAGVERGAVVAGRRGAADRDVAVDAYRARVRADVLEPAGAEVPPPGYG